MKITDPMTGCTLPDRGGASLRLTPQGWQIVSAPSRVNPNTPRQVGLRRGYSLLAAHWRTLTNTQKTAWDAYAASTPLPSIRCGTVTVDGYAMWYTCNQLRRQCGLGYHDTAPTSPGLEPDPAITWSYAAGKLSCNYDGAAPWVHEDDACLAINATMPQRQRATPLRRGGSHVGQVLGDSTLPSVPPEIVSLPWQWLPGQCVWAEGRVVRADGRVSWRGKTQVCATTGPKSVQLTQLGTGIAYQESSLVSFPLTLGAWVYQPNWASPIVVAPWYAVMLWANASGTWESSLSWEYIVPSQPTGQWLANSFGPGSNGQAFSNPLTLPVGWHHWVGTFSSASSRDVWVDGVQLASNGNAVSSPGSWDRIGIGSVPDIGHVALWTGNFAVAALYNRVLSGGEIAAWMGSNDAYAAVPSGCMGSWPLNGTLADSSGNGRTLIASGPVTYSNLGPH